jgi:PAS domain-containing protein
MRRLDWQRGLWAIWLVAALAATALAYWGVDRLGETERAWGRAYFEEARGQFVTRLDFMNERMRDVLRLRLDDFAAILRRGADSTDGAAWERWMRKVRFDRLVVLDTERKVVAAWGVFDPAAERYDYPFVAASLKNPEGGAGLVRTGDLFFYYLALPVMASGRLAGYVLAGYQVDDALMRRLRGESSIDFSLVGERMVAASSMRIDGEPIRELPMPYVVYTDLLRRPGRWIHLTIDGRKYLATAFPIRRVEVHPGGSLLLLVDRAAISPSYLLAWPSYWALGALFFVFAAGAGVMLWLRTSVAKPLQALRRCVEEGCEAGAELPAWPPFDRLAEAVRQALQKAEARGARAEGAACEGHAVWERACEEAPVLAMRVREGRLVYANRAVLAFFGAQSIEPLRTNFLPRLLISGDDDLCAWLARAEAREKTLRTVEGEARRYRVRVMPVDGERCDYFLFFEPLF